MLIGNLKSPKYIFLVIIDIFFSLQSQLAVHKSHSGGSAASDLSHDGRKPHYRPNQQLEELRNLQDKLSAEKTVWHQVKDQEQRDLDEKKQELLRLQVNCYFEIVCQRVYNYSCLLGAN